MRLDAMHHSLVDPIPFGQLRPNDGVRSFDVVVDGLADVVQQAAAADNTDVGAEFSGNNRPEGRGLDRMLELVLAVAGSILQPPEGAQHLGVQAGAAGLD